MAPRSTYHVRMPNGQVMHIAGPAGLSEEEILKQAERLNPRHGVVGAVDAFVRGAAGGATANFDDEISAGLNSVMPVDRLGGQNVRGMTEGPGGYMGAYRHNVATERAINAYDEEHHGGVRTGGEILGSIVGLLTGAREIGMATTGVKAAIAAARGSRALPLVMEAAAALPGELAQAPSLAARVARGAVGAAGFGALSGAGAGDTPDNRVAGAATGATMGALLGAGGEALMGVVGPATWKIVKALSSRGSTDEALSLIRGSLARSGYSVNDPQQLEALRAETSRLVGRQVGLADLGIAPRQAFLKGLRVPSPAQQPAIDAINARTAGQGARLATDVRANVAPRTDVHVLDDQLVAERDAKALPFKAQALRTTIDPAAPATPEIAAAYTARPDVQNALETGTDLPVVQSSIPNIPDDPILQQLVQLPAARNAYGVASKLTADTRARLTALGEDTSHLPDFPGEDAPMDMASMDTLKRVMDKHVSAAWKAGDPGAPELTALRNTIRSRMRAVGETAPGAGDGPYGQYLDNYSGPQELRDALTDGRTYRQSDPEQVVSGQDDRSQAGQEFYRVGAARDLIDTLNRTQDSAYPADRILNSPQARMSLEATGVPPAAVGNLEGATADERTLNLLPKAANRTVALGDVTPSEFTPPFNWTRTMPWVMAALRAGANRMQASESEAVASRLVPRMQPPAAPDNGEHVKRVIAELVANGKSSEARKVVAAQAINRTADLIGLSVGGPLAPQEDPNNQGVPY